MAHGSHDHHDIAPPKELTIPKNFVSLGIGLFILGLVFFAIGLFVEPVRAWRGYLIGYWFTVCLGLSGPFFVATQYLSRAGWSISIRRIPEAFGAFLYPAVALSAIMLLGAGKLFKWLKPEVVDDAVTSQKLGFLNFEGLALATIVASLLWAGGYFLMRRNSVTQDETGDASLSHKNMFVSAGFIVVFVIGISFMSWYWIMSLDPHWYSTMFSVYAFAGLFQSGLCLATIVLLYLYKRDYFGGTVGTQHIHDMGKLVFAFTVFYAYIAFCQFLLIWYANIPEATLWYLHRLDHGWGYFTLILPFFKFIIPFLLLLPQDHKKNKNGILWYMCWLLVFMQLYEVWYWISPYPSVAGSYAPQVPWLELPIALGFIGLFMVVVSRALAAHSLVPIKDPFLHESMPHEHTNYGSSQADLEAQVANVIHES